MDEANRTAMSPEHEEILLTMISERIGAGASRADFNEALLSVLEDVSGFELFADEDQLRLTQYFWDMYTRPRRG